MVKRLKNRRSNKKNDNRLEKCLIVIKIFFNLFVFFFFNVVHISTFTMLNSE